MLLSQKGDSFGGPFIRKRGLSCFGGKEWRKSRESEERVRIYLIFKWKCVGYLVPLGENNSYWTLLVFWYYSVPWGRITVIELCSCFVFIKPCGLFSPMGENNSYWNLIVFCFHQIMWIIQSHGGTCTWQKQVYTLEGAPVLTYTSPISSLWNELDDTVINENDCKISITWIWLFALRFH